MELALQVVGLKMTGKIEDAKDVAMRIVGSAGEETPSQAPDSSSMMQLATTNPASTREILPLLLNKGRDTENFETLIVNFLALLDTPLDKVTSKPMQTADAISHSSATGQTLLHYATFLGFESLTKFLVCHGVDVDARDRNGYTALHFAALSGSANCLRILLEAGADQEIVNARGKTAAEIAQANVLDILRETYPDSDDDHYSASDEDAVWGDGEEDAISQVPCRTMKRLSRRSSKRGTTLNARKLPFTNLPRASSLATLSTPEKTQHRPPEILKEKAGGDANDAKQTAWLREVVQRTLAQLHAPQGIIPNIPQLPLPHLPDFRNVPWNSLPQIPIVFPIFVPMPGWPSFLQSQSNDNKDQSEDAKKGMSAGALWTTQELRAVLEKWVAVASATATNQPQGETQQLDDTPPPRYTLRVGTERVPEASSSGSAATANQLDEQDAPHSTTPSEIRPVDYRQVQLTDKEVNSYTYAPSTKQAQKLQKKRELIYSSISGDSLVTTLDDRMLIVFWLPILFCMSCTTRSDARPLMNIL